MTTLDPLPRLISIITAQTPPALRWKIGAQANLAGDLHLDAIDRMTITCALDEAFTIELPDAAVNAWETVADVAASLAQLLGLDPHHLFPLEPGETA